MKWIMMSSGIVLCIALVGCGSFNQSRIIPPTADNVLDALRTEDERIIQVKLHQCIQKNMLGEPDAPQQFYDFDCQLSVERFDALLNQNDVKEEHGTITFTGGQWQMELSPYREKQ